MKTLGAKTRESILENFSSSFKYALKISDFSEQKFAEIAGLDISRLDDIKKGAALTNMEYLAIASVFDHVTYSDEAVYKAVVKILTPDDYKIINLDNDADFILVNRWFDTFNHENEYVDDELDNEPNDEFGTDEDDELDDEPDNEFGTNENDGLSSEYEVEDDNEDDEYEVEDELESSPIEYHYSQDALSDEELEFLTSDKDCVICADVTALKDENFPALINRLVTGLSQSGKKIFVSEYTFIEMENEIENCGNTAQKLALEQALKYVRRLLELGLIEIADATIDIDEAGSLASLKDILNNSYLDKKLVFITQDIERAKFAATKCETECEEINTYHVNDRGDLVFWGNFGM